MNLRAVCCFYPWQLGALSASLAGALSRCLLLLRVSCGCDLPVHMPIQEHDMCADMCACNAMPMCARATAGVDAAVHKIPLARWKMRCFAAHPTHTQSESQCHRAMPGARRRAADQAAPGAPSRAAGVFPRARIVGCWLGAGGWSDADQSRRDSSFYTLCLALQLAPQHHM